MFQGVVRHADVAANGSFTNWSDLNRGPAGDARGSSANALVDEFLGDYDFAFATDAFGVAVWNDARNAEDCPAIDAYRQSLVDGNPSRARRRGRTARRRSAIRTSSAGCIPIRPRREVH
jgi:hypothetical protein